MVPTNVTEQLIKTQRMLAAIEGAKVKYPDFEEMRPAMQAIAARNPWMDQSDDVVRVIDTLYLEAKQQSSGQMQAASRILPGLAAQAQLAQASGAWGYSTGVPTAAPTKYDGAYNKDTPCKACGEKGPHASKFVLETVRHRKDPADIGMQYEDKDRSVIRRTCTNCGHTWNEAPIYLVPELVAERMLGEKKDG